jgi:hypothetical protein
MYEGLAAHQGQSEHLEEEKQKLLLLPSIEPKFPGHPALSLFGKNNTFRTLLLIQKRSVASQCKFPGFSSHVQA